MTEFALTYAYTAAHRYDSDMDEKVEEAMAKLVEEIGGKMTGSAGGAFVGSGLDDLGADCSFYFTAPDLAAAEKVRDQLAPLLRFYDERYQAGVRVLDPMDEVDDDDDQLDDPIQDFDDDSHLAQYDDDPSPYSGTYSEE